MAEVLELLEIQNYNMLKTLMEKVDNIQEHLGKGSKEMEVAAKHQKETLAVNITDEECRWLSRQQARHGW